MKKVNDISSIDFYLPKALAKKRKKSLLSKNTVHKNFQILIQDDVENSIYLVDA